MTTFQDPPLQSRRSVRQNERDQTSAAVVPTTGPTPTPVAPAAPGEPLTYATQARPGTPDYEGPSFRARRTPEPVGDLPATEVLPAQDGAYRPRDYSPEGRRSASPSWAPQYGGAGQPPAAPVEPPVVPADPSSTFAPHAPAAPVVVPSSLDTDEPVEHTLTRRELRALRDAHGITATTTGETVYPTPEPASEPVAQAPGAEAPVAQAPLAEPPAAQAPVAPGTPLAAPSTRLDSALAEFDQLAAGRPAAVPSDPPAPRGRRAAAAKADEAEIAEVPVAPVIQPVAEVPVIQPAAPVASAVPEAPASTVPATPAPTTAGPAQVSPEVLGPQPVPLVEPAPPAPPTAQTPAGGVEVFDALFSAPSEPTPVAAQPEVVVAEVEPEPAPVPEAPAAPAETVVEAIVVETEPEAPAASEPSTSTPPTGHWTTQAQLDDETQFGDAHLARNIGATSGAITTSALVLPSIPDHDFGPLSTGDVLVTGSISLPASLAATGAHPAQIDESDLDHLLDPGDHQVANTDSQPVRAIKAVSTHTSSRGVIGTAKPKGTRGLTALIIAATGMAVLVGALFIVLVVTGQLG